jgi:nucleotide-binding universal stress UspA family protein
MEQAMFQPRLILCLTDLTPDSVFALEAAQDVARHYGAALLVLHVAETLGPDKLTYAEATSQLQPEAHIAALQRRLREAAPPQPGLEIRHLLDEGAPAQVVERVVRGHRCDLLVLSTHDRTGLSRLFLRSVAEEIIRRCPCPVLVFKYPHAD